MEEKVKLGGTGMAVVTLRVQILARPQQLSSACQVCVKVMLHTLEVVGPLLSSVIVTLVQHKSMYAGGLV
jgi:hypothetical protein